ncbi:MAG TPA: hydroxymethylglutaryl-CoA lyase [Spirochaetia bacterium]
MPERVRITEVGPRDGLQNEPGVIPTAEKVRLVELCCATGVDEVEATSFVSPKWVPQLGDAAEVVTRLVTKEALQWPERADTLLLSVLIPNRHGLDSLLKTEGDLSKAQWSEESVRSKDEGIEMWIADASFVRKISFFTAASETFSRRNTNATIAQSLDRLAEMLRGMPERPECLAKKVRAYISCVIACPFEGPIHPRRVAEIAAKLKAMGVDEIDLGDTIGAADVASTVHLLEVLRDELGELWFSGQQVTLHLHDTFNRASDCVKAALDLGVRSFDGSVAGLGGCPYASTPGKRAPGNISTETLVKTVHAAGYETGVDLDKLAIAADYARSIVAKSRTSAEGRASA